MHDPSSRRRPHIQRRGKRWRIAVPMVLLAGLGLGTFGAWLTRSSAVAVTSALGERGSYPNPRESAAVPQVDAQMPHEPVAVESSPSTSGPFVISGKGQVFRNLRDAVRAANDQDTILICGNGPFFLQPLEIRGKSLTLKAAPGFRPRLERVARDPFCAWQALFAVDRDLTLEGLELNGQENEETGAAKSPIYLIENQRASLYMRDCRLLAPANSAPIVCREPQHVELDHCSLVAAAAVLYVEVGSGDRCEIVFRDNQIRINDPSAPALSLFARDGGRPLAPVSLNMEHNTVVTGRLAAFKAVTGGVHILAHRNHVTFREALFSFVDHPGWRNAITWAGTENQFQSRNEWVQVDGRPMGIGSLAAWQDLWATN